MNFNRLCLIPLVALLASCGQPEKTFTDADRSKALVDAIQTHVAETGSAPKDLKTLAQVRPVPIIDSAELADTSRYIYKRSASDSKQFEIEIANDRVPTRELILYRSSKDYADCVPGARLNMGYKVIESKPAANDSMILQEQSD